VLCRFFYCIQLAAECECDQSVLPPLEQPATLAIFDVVQNVAIDTAAISVSILSNYIIYPEAKNLNDF
jgi:hypothetical protein